MKVHGPLIASSVHIQLCTVNLNDKEKNKHIGTKLTDMATLPNIRNELLTKIQQLSQKHHLSLFRQLRKTNDLANLRATLTEPHFGLFFDKHCQNLRYDKAVFTGSKKTPDWCLQKNGQTIIAEVYRLNPSEDELSVSR
jgi:hypothetical protein